MADACIFDYGKVEEVVDSKSAPGTRHIVIIENGKPFCTCEGFHWRGKCPHTDFKAFPDTIYCTVDPKDIKDVPDENRSKIYELLDDDRDKWHKAYEIAEACDYPKGPTQVEVRKAITQLIEMDLVPIISGNRGFKYAQSNEEIDTYIESLQGRVNGIVRRIVALKKMTMERS